MLQRLPQVDCAAAAAASLVLLGSQQQQHQQSTAPLRIAVGRDSSRPCNTAMGVEGLCTPLPPMSFSVRTTAAPTVTGSADISPYLSPVADKLQHGAAGSWRVHGADDRLLAKRSASLQTDQPATRVSSKRQRLERSTASSRIDGLARGEVQTRSPAPSANTTQERPAAWSEVATTTASSEHKRGPAEQLAAPLASVLPSTEQNCAVAGCPRLMVAPEAEKCAVHKGLKLCAVGDCCRPVQSRGFCKSHGGGARCQHAGCVKGAISKGRCRSHGGGTRCAVPSCAKWAQRLGCCVRHSKALVSGAHAGVRM
ncbi:hypothetical protein PybrP1_010013 [[Pythium] brassicae (nom. inval.)]|nr:hypothetical protein PybrP1_010013 [[Pythium] brassicae (nom. inval.)]